MPDGSKRDEDLIVSREKEETGSEIITCCELKTDEEVPISSIEDEENGIDSNTDFEIQRIKLQEKRLDKSEEESFLKPFQKLFADLRTLAVSINVLRFAIFADAVNTTILQPNLPLMVLQGPKAPSDAFTSTSPFNFNAATYFIPMMSLLGVAISSVIVGFLSDKWGRKPCLLICLWGAAAGSALQYFMRFNFWAFCGANFATGLFGASLPVALAYSTDVYRERRKKDSEIGILVGMSMIGYSGGGIIAILMESQGLFFPLWVGVILTIFAALLTTFFLIEPNPNLFINDSQPPHDDEYGSNELPEHTNALVMWNIILGALVDNLGSAGLYPLCLSPLAFTVYYLDFLDIEPAVSPIMSEIAFKWISVILAFTVIPTCIISPWIFNKIGTSGACVFGNLITGVVTACLLYIGVSAPPTRAWFGSFCTILYVGFPFTVVSQLSTGPMIDAISPVEKRGFAQGLNITVMNLGSAVAPYLYGLLADSTGVFIAIWVSVGVSIAAAIINTPLIFINELGPPPKIPPKESRPLLGEDQDLVQLILDGKWVPREDFDRINEERMRKGRPFLVVHFGNYADERDYLKDLNEKAKSDYIYLRKSINKYIEQVNEQRDVDVLCEQFNNTMDSIDPVHAKEVHKELGQWFADYLEDSGYIAHTDATLTKQMIMSAFPVITKEKKLTPENIEQVLLNTKRVYSRYIHLEEDGQLDDLKKMLSVSQSALFVSKV